MSTRKIASIVALVALILVATDTRAGQESADEQETVTQLWGNLILDYPKEDYLLEVDVEPKLQVQGEPRWRNIDVTPLVEYYPNHWFDLTAEATVGITHQNDDVSTFELTPRIGARFHILSNLREKLKTGMSVFGRFGLANFSRIEYRNFWYTGRDQDASHEWRFRNRTELRIGLNKANFNADAALYAIADIEGFVPLGDEVEERFATRLRTRVGVGYRFGYKTRFEALYIRDEDRNTLEGDFRTSSNIFDVRLKLFF